MALPQPSPSKPASTSVLQPSELSQRREREQAAMLRAAAVTMTVSEEILGRRLSFTA